MPTRKGIRKATKAYVSSLKMRSSAKSIAVRALKQVNKINRNADKKFLDVEIGTDTPGTTASITYLSPCAQGNSDITRIGDTISPKAIEVNAYAFVHASAAYDVCRAILFMDKENRGVIPSATELLMTAADVRAHRNTVYTKRFRVLRDKKFTLDPSGNSSKFWKWYLPLTKPIKYGSNNGDITDARENNLFVLLVGVQNTNKTTFSMKSRIVFTDM